MNREQWLTSASDEIALWIPELVKQQWRVSVGFPSKRATASKNRRIGECWYPPASDDGSHELFISPTLDAKTALGVLAHELVHVTVGHKAGHKAPFKRCATALGLEGKMTATTVGEALQVKLDTLEKTLGPFPGAPLNAVSMTKKQGTRLLKAECLSCGCIVRITQKWVDEVGAPFCACEHGPMAVGM